MKKYIPLINNRQYIFISKEDRNNILEESLRLSDLMKSASMSAFTKKFAKETNKLMGNATNRAKLVQMKVNKKEDYVTFIWLTERTPKYKDNFHTMISNPNKNFELEQSNVYEIEIRFLDFFKLLDTRPNNDEITNKDIEDVLNNSDIKIWSDVPAFHWQGANYNLSLFDASIYPTNIAPKQWNKFHNEDQLLDKHSASILNSIKFWIPQMRMMIKKYMGITKK